MTPRLEKDNSLGEHDLRDFKTEPGIKAKSYKKDATVLVDNILVGIA